MAGRACRRCSAGPRCAAKFSWVADTRALVCSRGASGHSDCAGDAAADAACAAMSGFLALESQELGLLGFHMPRHTAVGAWTRHNAPCLLRTRLV